MSQGPNELDLLAQDEERARLALADARERNEMDEGVAEHESVIQRLEAEWKHALERLEHARKT